MCAQGWKRRELWGVIWALRGLGEGRQRFWGVFVRWRVFLPSPGLLSCRQRSGRALGSLPRGFISLGLWHQGHLVWCWILLPAPTRPVSSRPTLGHLSPQRQTVPDNRPPWQALRTWAVCPRQRDRVDYSALCALLSPPGALLPGKGGSVGDGATQCRPLVPSGGVPVPAAEKPPKCMGLEKGGHRAWVRGL